ncbi:MAG: DUF692 family protein [Anaerolineae bacterium]|nr:DUF692 family protein [Anaerolineae bacterium]
MSPQLAALYSQPLMALLAEGKAPVDRIVVCPWHTEAQIRQARSRRPLLLHNMPAPFVLNQPDPFDKTIMAQAERLLDLVDPAWFSLNFGLGVKASQHDGQVTLRSETQPRSQVYLNTCHNVARLKRWLAVPLLLENPAYQPNSAYEYACEPLFLTAVLDAVDCGFLLDIAHARVSAHNLGFYEERYFRSLPLFRVREVHATGSRLREGAMTGAHEPLQDEDWEALAFVLARTKPEVVTLEHTRDKDLLRGQLQRLRGML